MKKNILITLFSAVTLTTLSAIVEFDNYYGRLCKLKKSPIYHLPVNLTTQIIATSSTAIFTLLVIVTTTIYLIKTKIS